MIPLSKPNFTKNDVAAIRNVLKSGWVAGQGPKSREFAEAFAKRIHSRYATPVGNCTEALHLALLALGIKPGDEVLVPDFTFPATSHSVLYVGATPRFVDVDLQTYNMDPDRIEERITEKTKAIMPVHAFGQAAQIDRIIKLAKKHNLRVIEDAACAAGARFDDKYVGTFGDVGCFSFHAKKNITTGEGGMVVTPKKSIHQTVQKCSAFGIPSAYDRNKSDKVVIPKIMMLGYNYKMSDYQAALGITQLQRLDSLIARRKELAQCYDEELATLNFIQTPLVARDAEHIYQGYVCVLDKDIPRNKVIEMMRKKGIQMQFGTWACSVQPVYRTKDRCPNSLALFRQTLQFPMFYDLTFAQIRFIAKTLKSVVARLG